MTQELKPCLFCGGKAEICEGGINGKMQVYGLVEHKDGCFFLADGLPTRYQHIMESEFDAWNTRAERTCKQKRLFNLMSRECDGEYYEWHGEEKPNYCPNCGAKVVNA